MMFGDEDRHRVLEPFADVHFYKNGVACFESDGPDEVEVKCTNSYVRFKGETCVRDAYDAYSLMSSAYDRGKIDRSNQFCSLLGVTPDYRSG